MRIKKTSQTTTTAAQVVNTYNTSTTDAYCCNYINEKIGTLIWINPLGMNNSYSSTTTYWNVSEYKKFDFYYFADTGSTVIQNATITGKDSDYIINYQSGVYKRTVKITNSSLVIQQGYYNDSQNNNAIIPAYIIGYK